MKLPHWCMIACSLFAGAALAAEHVWPQYSGAFAGLAALLGAAGTGLGLTSPSVLGAKS